MTKSEKKSTTCPKHTTPSHDIVASYLDVDKSLKEPAANKLSKKRIDKLFRMFCVHTIACHEAGTRLIEAEKCSQCILREVPWAAKDGQVKDLCHAIWHEGVLNG